MHYDQVDDTEPSSSSSSNRSVTVASPSLVASVCRPGRCCFGSPYDGQTDGGGQLADGVGLHGRK